MRGLLIVLALVFSSPALAQDASKCVAPDVVLTDINGHLPVKGFAKLDPAQTSDVVAWLNKESGEHDSWNYVLVVFHENGRIGLLTGNDGLVCEGQLIPDERIEGFIKALQGVGA